jgi:hypothetical protein
MSFREAAPLGKCAWPLADRFCWKPAPEGSFCPQHVIAAAARDPTEMDEFDERFDRLLNLACEPTAGSA